MQEVGGGDTGLFECLNLEALFAPNVEMSIPVETYFGKTMTDPVTGKLVDTFVNRKKLNIILRAREQNKAITDVYLSRSDGKRHAAARDLAINRLEIKARKEQQQVTNHFLQRALHQDLHEPRPAVGHQMEVFQEGGNLVSFTHNTARSALVDLETWAKRTERAQSTFGSSAFPMPTPMVTSV